MDSTDYYMCQREKKNQQMMDIKPPPPRDIKPPPERAEEAGREMSKAHARERKKIKKMRSKAKKTTHPNKATTAKDITPPPLPHAALRDKLKDKLSLHKSYRDGIRMRKLKDLREQTCGNKTKINPREVFRKMGFDDNACTALMQQSNIKNCNPCEVLRKMGLDEDVCVRR